MQSTWLEKLLRVSHDRYKVSLVNLIRDFKEVRFCSRLLQRVNKRSCNLHAAARFSISYRICCVEHQWSAMKMPARKRSMKDILIGDYDYKFLCLVRPATLCPLAWLCCIARLVSNCDIRIHKRPGTTMSPCSRFGLPSPLFSVKACNPS